jgi:hypothetical protein
MTNPSEKGCTLRSTSLEHEQLIIAQLHWPLCMSIRYVNVTRQAGKLHSTAGAVVRLRDACRVKCDAYNSRSEYSVKNAERTRSLTVISIKRADFVPRAVRSVRAKRKYTYGGSPTSHNQHQDPSAPVEEKKHLLKTDGSTTTYEEHDSKFGSESAKCKSGKKEALQRKWPSKCPTDTENGNEHRAASKPGKLQASVSCRCFLSWIAFCNCQS